MQSVRPVLNLNGVVSLMSHLSLIVAMTMVVMMMAMMMMTMPSFEEWDLLPCVEIKIASAVGSLDGTLKSNHP